MIKPVYFIPTSIFTILFLISPKLAFAHVKWFSNFSFADQPKTIPEILDFTFWGLMALSVIVILLLVIFDYKLANVSWAKKLTSWLEENRKYSLTVMRAAAAAVLLLSFQSGALFVPELSNGTEALGWIQFFLAVLLLFKQTVIISGLGILGLYFYGVAQYGWFHMLDYPIFAGVGYYLIVSSLSNEKVKATGLITLYVTVGFSLAWVAIEKFLYPQWGLYVLQQNPQLSLGLNMKFFLTAAGFIEISLGYLMMIGLLQRPLALVVTLVFFLTTMIFGKTEVIGHTIIHAALIVFLIEGSGRTYTTPMEWHRTLWLRLTFAGVNFVLLVFLLLVPYEKVATAKYESTVQQIKDIAGVELPLEHAPKIQLELVKDDVLGYALHIKTTNFHFAPEHTGQAYIPGEGHAHVYIDHKKVGRAYSEWFYIEPQGKGHHQVRVVLNTNDHRIYMVEGKPIESTITIEGAGGAMVQGHQH